MTPLRQRMLDAMVLRGFVRRTQWTYVTAVKQLAGYHDWSMELLSDQQIQAYLLHLLQERHRSRSTVNTTSCAIRFLVYDVLLAAWEFPSRKVTGLNSGSTECLILLRP